MRTGSVCSDTGRVRNRNYLPFTFALLVVFSGSAALIYEVAWNKAFAFLLGTTTASVAAVIASVMGGMSLGAFISGRMSDRIARPLQAYGLVQLGIALTAPFVPFLAMRVVPMADGYTGQTGLLIRFALLLLLTMPSTVLLGAAFPLVVRGLWEQDGRITGRIYGANCLGAASGALCAGFILMPSLGLRGTLSVGAALSLFAGLCALLSARNTIRPDYIESASAAVVPWLLLVLYGMAGAAAMIYEIAWIRMLAVIIGSSTYSFSIILFVFIIGLSTGGWIHKPLSSRFESEAFLASSAAIGIAMWGLYSLVFFSHLPNFFLRFYTLAHASFHLYEATKVIIVAFVLFPPTVLMGLLLPSFCKLAAGSRPGSDVGAIYSANTAGCVIGSIVAGLVLIPALGTHSTVVIAAICYAVISFILMSKYHGSVMTMAVAVLFFVMYGVVNHKTGVSWNPWLFTSGTFYRQERFYRDDGSIYSSFARAGHFDGDEHNEMFYFREGKTAAVAVYRSGNMLSLSINGKADASTALNDMRTQKLLAHLPIILREGDAEDMLIIGLGSGVTLGSALEHDTVKRVDCVELSPEVIEASRFFELWNNKYWEDERASVYEEDGRFWLRATDSRYDLIISEPSNTWISGVGNLFTVEHFEASRNRLKPGGHLVQWMHGYEISDEIFQMVVRSMFEVFPNVWLWRSSFSDLLLIASDEPWEPDWDRVKQIMDNPRIASSLAEIGITSRYQIAMLECMPSDLLRDWAGEGPLNTDDMPLLEYMSPRSLLLNEQVSLDELVTRYNSLHQITKLDRPDYETLMDMEKLAADYMKPLEMRLGILQQAHELGSPDAALKAAGLTMSEMGAEAALYWLDKVPSKLLAEHRRRNVLNTMERRLFEADTGWADDMELDWVAE